MPFHKLQAQIKWELSKGGSQPDYAHSINRAADWGFIIAGYSSSSDGDVANNQGGRGDFWLVKVSATGDFEWEKTYGGSGMDWAFNVKTTDDRGYVVAGDSRSNDGDVGDNNGSGDIWVVKLSETGKLEWEKNYGGKLDERAEYVLPTSDTGYIIAGWTKSSDEDVTGHHGSDDYWVLKLDENGELEWQKALGGSNLDRAKSVRETDDGGFIVVGTTRSSDGDISNFKGTEDIWVVKLKSTGKLEWERTYGGTSGDNGYSIRNTSDGGFIVGGSSFSENGDVSENNGGWDFWIFKINQYGRIQWERSYGGSGDEVAYLVRTAPDSGFIAAGETTSNDSDVTGNHGKTDYWLVRLDDTGSIVWQRSLGGIDDDWGRSVSRGRRNGWIMAGGSKSSDGDVTGNKGAIDYWIVKYDTTLGTGTKEPLIKRKGIKVFPNPSDGMVYLNGRFLDRDKATIEVLNPQGRVVARKVKQNNKTGSVWFDLSNIKKGLYFIRIFNDKGVKVKKLLLN